MTNTYKKKKWKRTIAIKIEKSSKNVTHPKIPSLQVITINFGKISTIYIVYLGTINTTFGLNVQLRLVDVSIHNLAIYVSDIDVDIDFLTFL